MATGGSANLQIFVDLVSQVKQGLPMVESELKMLENMLKTFSASTAKASAGALGLDPSKTKASAEEIAAQFQTLKNTLQNIFRNMPLTNELRAQLEGLTPVINGIGTVIENGLVKRIETSLASINKLGAGQKGAFKALANQIKSELSAAFTADLIPEGVFNKLHAQLAQAAAQFKAKGKFELDTTKITSQASAVIKELQTIGTAARTLGADMKKVDPTIGKSINADLRLIESSITKAQTAFKQLGVAIKSGVAADIENAFKKVVSSLEPVNTAFSKVKTAAQGMQGVRLDVNVQGALTSTAQVVARVRELKVLLESMRTASLTGGGLGDKGTAQLNKYIQEMSTLLRLTKEEADLFATIFARGDAGGGLRNALAAVKDLRTEFNSIKTSAESNFKAAEGIAKQAATIMKTALADVPKGFQVLPAVKAQMDAALGAVRQAAAQAGAAFKTIKPGIDTAQARAAADQIAAALNNTKQALAQLEAMFVQTGGAAGKLGVAETNLAASMGKKTTAAKSQGTALGETQGKMQSLMTLSYQFTHAGFQLGMLGDTLKKAFDAPIESLKNVQKEIGFVNALYRGTAEEGQKLRDLAIDLSTKSLFSSEEIAKGMKTLALAGLDMNEVMENVGPVMDFAASGMMNLDEAAKFAISTVTAYGLEMDKLPLVMDTLSRAANVSNTDLQSMGKAFEQLGPVAHQLGESVKESAVNVALLSKAGLESGPAATQLRGLYRQLALMGEGKAPKDAQAAFNKLGIVLRDSQDNFVGLENVINQFNEKMKDMSKADVFGQVMTMFKQRGGSTALLAMMEQQKNALEENTSAWTEMADAMSKVAGPEELAARRLEDMFGKITLLKNAWEGLKATLGSAIESAGIGNFIDAFTGFLNLIKDAINQVPGVKELVGGILAFTAAIGTFAAAGGALTLFLGILSSSIALFSATGPFATLGAQLKIIGVEMGIIKVEAAAAGASIEGTAVAARTATIAWGPLLAVAVKFAATLALIYKMSDVITRLFGGISEYRAAGKAIDDATASLDAFNKKVAEGHKASKGATDVADNVKKAMVLLDQLREKLKFSSDKEEAATLRSQMEQLRKIIAGGVAQIDKETGRVSIVKEEKIKKEVDATQQEIEALSQFAKEHGIEVPVSIKKDSLSKEVQTLIDAEKLPKVELETEVTTPEIPKPETPKLDPLKLEYDSLNTEDVTNDEVNKVKKILTKEQTDALRLTIKPEIDGKAVAKLEKQIETLKGKILKTEEAIADGQESENRKVEAASERTTAKREELARRLQRTNEEEARKTAAAIEKAEESADKKRTAALEKVQKLTSAAYETKKKLTELETERQKKLSEVEVAAATKRTSAAEQAAKAEDKRDKISDSYAKKKQALLDKLAKQEKAVADARLAAGKISADSEQRVADISYAAGKKREDISYSLQKAERDLAEVRDEASDRDSVAQERRKKNLEEQKAKLAELEAQLKKLTGGGDKVVDVKVPIVPEVKPGEELYGVDVGAILKKVFGKDTRTDVIEQKIDIKAMPTEEAMKWLNIHEDKGGTESTITLRYDVKGEDKVLQASGRIKFTLKEIETLSAYYAQKGIEFKVDTSGILQVPKDFESVLIELRKKGSLAGREIGTQLAEGTITSYEDKGNAIVTTIVSPVQDAGKLLNAEGKKIWDEFKKTAAGQLNQGIGIGEGLAKDSQELKDFNAETKRLAEQLAKEKEAAAEASKNNQVRIAEEEHQKILDGAKVMMADLKATIETSFREGKISSGSWEEVLNLPAAKTQIDALGEYMKQNKLNIQMGIDPTTAETAFREIKANGEAAAIDLGNTWGVSVGTNFEAALKNQVSSEIFVSATTDAASTGGMEVGRVFGESVVEGVSNVGSEVGTKIGTEAAASTKKAFTEADPIAQAVSTSAPAVLTSLASTLSKMTSALKAWAASQNITVTVKVKKVEQKATGGLVGGFIQGMATGGHLPGYGGGDRRLTMLEDGEYVLPKEVVRNVGVGFLEYLRSSFSSSMANFSLGVPKMAAGGQVGAPVAAKSLGTYTLEFKTGGKTYPLSGSKQVVSALLEQLRREGMTVK